MATATATDLPTRMYIDGEWTAADDGKTLGVINPADESTVAEVAYGSRAEADRAIEAASLAFPAWRSLSAYDRAKVLKKTADLMRERADKIARTLTREQGKPLAEAKAEVLHSADTFEWFAEEGKRAYGRIIPHSNVLKRHYAIKHPVGVVGTITPWNFPAALPSRKIAPALAVGCTVVSRPADQTPLTLIQMFECLADAGLPPGVANLVIGPARPVADAFFAHPAVRKVSFTGSTEVGKELIRRSADGVKRLSLELGGHAPLIVFPDADVAQVAQAAVIGKFRNNGQVCIAPSRFYVHEKISKDFTEAAVDLTRKLKIGNGLEDGVQVGPMFESRALDKTAGLIDDAKSRGAKVLTGGGRSSRFDKGYWFEPTILREVDGAMRVMTEEPFAPVMPLLDFSRLEDVIAAANNTPYGLAAYVFTNDLTVATRMAEGLEAGIIGINDPVPATPQCPFGGMKESGLGRELGIEGLDAYLETKYVSIGLRLTAPPEKDRPMSLAASPSQPRTMTAEEMLALPDDGMDRELIRGQIRERPMTLRNWRHSSVESKIAQILWNWVDAQQRPRGRIHSGEAGFRLRRNPDSFVGVDVAYVSAELVAATDPKAKFPDGAPVLAVEILSPSDSHDDIVTKVGVYLDAGSVVWVVDPDFRTVRVHVAGQEVVAYNVLQELTADPYLPGFRVKVADFFP